jgi:hypothetical protein
MNLTRQQLVILAALVAGAILAAVVEFAPRPAAPTPSDGGLSLRGKFIGPEAADDAAAFAGLCAAVADCLAKDGAATTPRITTGAQLEDLRIATSEGRFLPRSLSREQPHVSAAAGHYLDNVVGTSGGPIDATARSRWVAAFKALAAASEEAVR